MLENNNSNNFNNDANIETIKVLKDIRDILVKTANRVHEGFVQIERQEDKNEAVLKSIATNINQQLRNFVKVEDKLIDVAKQFELYAKRQESILKVLPQIDKTLEKLLEREQKLIETIQTTNKTTQYITSNIKLLFNKIGLKITEYLDKSFNKQIQLFELPATQKVFKDIQTEIAKEFKTALLFSQKQITDTLRITEATIEDIIRNADLDDFQKAAIKKIDQLAYATERKFFDGKDWYTATFELLFSINRILVEMLLTTQKFSSIQITQFSELKNVIKTLDNIKYVDKNVQLYYGELFKTFENTNYKLPLFARLKIWKKGLYNNPLLQIVMARDLNNKENIEFLKIFTKYINEYNNVISLDNILMVEMFNRLNLSYLELKEIKHLFDIPVNKQKKFIDKLKRDFATNKDLLRALILQEIPKHIAEAEDEEYYQFLLDLSVNKIIYDLRFALSDTRAFKFLYNQYSELGLKKEFLKTLDAQMYTLNKYFYRSIYNALNKVGGITRELLLSGAAISLMSTGPIGTLLAVPLLVSTGAYFILGKEWIGKWLVTDVLNFIKNIPFVKRLTEIVANFIQKNIIQNIQTFFTVLNNVIDNNKYLSFIKQAVLKTLNVFKIGLQKIVNIFDTLTGGFVSVFITKFTQVSKVFLKGIGLGFIEGFFAKKKEKQEPVAVEDLYSKTLGKLKNVQQVTLQTIHEDLLLLLENLPNLFKIDNIKIQISDDLVNNITKSLDVLKSYFQTLLDVLFGAPSEWDHNTYEIKTKLLIAEGVGMVLRELPQLPPIRTNVISLPNSFAVDLTNSFKAAFDCTICDLMQKQIDILTEILKTIKASTAFNVVSKMADTIIPGGGGGGGLKSLGKTLAVLYGLKKMADLAIDGFKFLFKKAFSTISDFLKSGAITKTVKIGIDSLEKIPRIALKGFKSLFGNWKVGSSFAGLLEGISEYAESGNIAKAITKGVGTTAGAYIVGRLLGGALGSFGGPAGTIIGSFLGGYLANKGYDLVSNYLAKNSFSDIIKDAFTNIFGAFTGGGPLSFLNAESIYNKITDFISGLFGNNQSTQTGQYTLAPSNKNSLSVYDFKLKSPAQIQSDLDAIEKYINSVQPQQTTQSNLVTNQQMVNQQYAVNRIDITQQNQIISLLSSMNNNLGLLVNLLTDAINGNNRIDFRPINERLKPAH